MPTIVTRKYRTDQVKETLNKYSRLDSGGLPTDYLYMLFGKSSAWANEALPDAPIDSADYHASTWADVIALSRVSTSEISPVVRRVNWSNTNIFVTLDAASGIAYESDFYCINSVHDVFLCTATSGAAPTVEPIYDGTNLTYTDGGYTWEYLYSLSTADAAKFLSPLWMPINYNTTLKVNENIKSLDLLGASDVMVYRLIDAAAPFDNMVAFPSYRQVSLCRNPLDNGGLGIIVVLNELLSNTPNTANTGELSYIENRTVVYRNVGQSEEIRLVLAF